MRWEVQTAIIGAAGIVFSAGLSALAVMITQHRPDERHDRIREQDQAAEAERRRAELEADDKRRAEDLAARDLVYQREIEERWRDERREAHSRLIADLERAWQGVSAYASSMLSRDPDAYPPRRDGDDVVSKSDLERLNKSLSNVRLICSPDAAKFARTAQQGVWIINLAERPALLKVGQVTKYKDRYYESMEKYQAAARRELGVERVVPQSPDPTLSESP